MQLISSSEYSMNSLTEDRGCTYEMTFTPQGNGIYELTFTPQGKGIYKITTRVGTITQKEVQKLLYQIPFEKVKIMTKETAIRLEHLRREMEEYIINYLTLKNQVAPPASGPNGCS